MPPIAVEPPVHLAPMQRLRMQVSEADGMHALRALAVALHVAAKPGHSHRGPAPEHGQEESVCMS